MRGRDDIANLLQIYVVGEFLQAAEKTPNMIALDNRANLKRVLFSAVSRSSRVWIILALSLDFEPDLFHFGHAIFDTGNKAKIPHNSGQIRYAQDREGAGAHSQLEYL